MASELTEAQRQEYTTLARECMEPVLSCAARMLEQAVEEIHKSKIAPMQAELKHWRSLSHDDLCRLSRVFNVGANLANANDHLINEWLKQAISDAAGRKALEHPNG